MWLTPHSYTFLSFSGFVAYLGFVNVLVAHSHPVMLTFCQLLINRNKDRGLEEAAPNNQPSLQPASLKEVGGATGMYEITKYPGARSLKFPKTFRARKLFFESSFY